MKYRAVIRYKDVDGNIKEESAALTALNEQDAELQRHFNEEYAKKLHGAENVISTNLVKE